jgi:hypothetical protein
LKDSRPIATSVTSCHKHPRQKWNPEFALKPATCPELTTSLVAYLCSVRQIPS